MIRHEEYLKYGIVIPADAKPNTKGNVYVRCPNCKDTRQHREKSNDPVLGVHIEKECWGCNNCGWTGSLKKKRDVNSEFKSKLNNLVKKDMSVDNPIIKWFWDKRRISLETLLWAKVFIAENNIYIKRSKNPAELGKYLRKNCVHFPYMVQGDCVNIKFRDNTKNFGSISGGTLVFYGLDHIQFDDWCIIVEGEIDKLSWKECGVLNVLSVPNGAQITDEERKKIINGEVFESHMNLEYVDNSYDYIQHIKKFIIATDDDPPGIKLRNELARRLGKHRCCFITFHGAKDSNQLLVEKGKEELYSLLNETIEFPIENVITARDVWKELEYEYMHGKPKGLSLGWKTLAPHWNIRKGDFIVGNGYMKNGKTAFSFNIIAITAVLYDWKWAIYSPENYPIRRVYDMLAEIILGCSSDMEAANRMLLKDFRNVVLSFLQNHIYVIADNKRYAPGELNDKYMELIAKYGIVGCLKDPWNSLKHRYKGTLDEYLEDALSEETSFAIRNDIASIVNAHPPTPIRNLEKIYPAPSEFEIRGGIIWPAKAYVQYCIHRTGYEIDNTMTEIHIQKTKDNKLMGYPTGKNPVLLKFERKSNRYLELLPENGGKWSHPLTQHIDILNQQLKIEL